MIYLDANASEPLRPQARAAAQAALDITGNPASVHAPGRAARRVLETAREAVAALCHADPADLVFTSGGTEAAALALHGLSYAGTRAKRRVVLGATEHDALRQAAPDAATLPVDALGLPDLDWLSAWLAQGPPALVALMLANNETGAILPVAQAAELCRLHGALLVVDAVQAAGRLKLHELGADALILSGHKLGAPAGAGALVLAPGLAIAPLLAGGGQERGRRGGTPPLSAIAGFGAAAACVDLAAAARLGRLRDQAEAAALAQGARVCAGGVARLANTTCLALPGVRADAQVIALDLAGVAVSAGAACSSGKVAASHVLAAMGLGALSGQAIRVSLPWNVAPSDIVAFTTAYADMAVRLVRHAA